ncbi:sulfate adenylyltransferase subunit 2 [Actinomadura graeca]|uniref:Sulfate adenylyltransferase subunit 2 n=1 Tax=Actinomadura graeca TaxID=2750812 RepID=A0ABX8QY60_9ACTN|nr:sulfate adenylyltransferase subunit CysD [Actinomadura graeca]QXJ22392.1 sulfate adenylyltransferase subunit 2 [Actinomadura graeca]
MPAHDLQISHLEVLESQAVHVIRETAGTLGRPALLFSGGKDSTVLAHLARRAFWPAPVPFPAVHVDTGHNFPEVIEFRDAFLGRLGMRLITVSLPDMIRDGRLTEPPGAVGRNRLQAGALLQAVEEHGFDALLGGARRDEEKARAKERVFSLRDEFGQWEPRDQRPELWSNYNTALVEGHSLRVFPLSNWTEADVWSYIERHDVELPPLYYAHDRKVFARDGMFFADNPFVPPGDGEEPRRMRVRFRTVGDMLSTGAIESAATTPAEVLREMAESRLSERGATRADDRFSEAAMEERKREGYF